MNPMSTNRAAVLALLMFLLWTLVIIFLYMEDKQECRLAAISHNYAAVEVLAICGDPR